jgi:hypothetical protein
MCALWAVVAARRAFFWSLRRLRTCHGTVGMYEQGKSEQGESGAQYESLRLGRMATGRRWGPYPEQTRRGIQ